MPPRIHLGVLVPTRAGDMPPPEQRPIGRAALALAGDGIELVFGDHAEPAGAGRAARLSGWIARPGRFVPARGVAVAAAYDRFPYRLAPARHDALVTALAGVPIANPPALMRLCQDKVASHRFIHGLGVPTPAIETDPARFVDRCAAWGAAFRKPRFGTAGRGVARVTAGEPWPPRPAGPTADADGPPILQRAVPPPATWRGACVRVTAQRVPGGRWHINPAVARLSADDWVANAARGATVRLADSVIWPSTTTTTAIDRLVRAVCDGLAASPEGAWMVEVGVDLVIDADGAPWMIELNARPQGRLAALAALDPARFGDAHRATLARPLRFLAAALASSAPPT